MHLQKVEGKSAKTGKSYTGYKLVIGKYESPLFFPTRLESWYIDEYLKKQEEHDEEQYAYSGY